MSIVTARGQRIRLHRLCRVGKLGWRTIWYDMGHLYPLVELVPSIATVRFLGLRFLEIIPSHALMAGVELAQY